MDGSCTKCRAEDQFGTNVCSVGRTEKGLGVYAQSFLKQADGDLP